MNVSLDRLIEGIIQTLRSDVIPHVADTYARGQAVGVIDLLNNIGPRIEWARQALLVGVLARRAALSTACELAPRLGPKDEPANAALMSSAELEAERDRLDVEIGRFLARLDVPDGAGERAAFSVLKAHMHEELTREMTLTKKPLFAEIASGRS